MRLLQGEHTGATWQSLLELELELLRWQRRGWCGSWSSRSRWSWAAATAAARGAPLVLGGGGEEAGEQDSAGEEVLRSIVGVLLCIDGVEEGLCFYLHKGQYYHFKHFADAHFWACDH